jgi:hypothetical protein
MSVFIHTGLEPGGQTANEVRNRFNGFYSRLRVVTPFVNKNLRDLWENKPLKRFSLFSGTAVTGLKPGVNEIR